MNFECCRQKPLVILVSGHVLQSRRRASFHWLASAFHRRGWRVLFMTVGISPLSRLRQDVRLDEFRRAEHNRVTWQDEDLGSFVWMTRWHPFNLRNRVLNALSAPIFRLYGALPLGELECFVRAADLLIIESAPGLLLVERFRRLNPRARIIYRVSDDLRVLGAHPVLAQAEKTLAPTFDLISVPSPRLMALFAPTTKLALQRHGIEASRFEGEVCSPYASASTRRRIVSVGTMLFDREFFGIAAEAMPDIEFHIIGKIAPFLKRDNVFFHGERPFQDTIAFMKWADAGVAPYEDRLGGAYLADTSNKGMQYTLCRLPYLAPECIRDRRPNAIAYRPGDRVSIVRALEEALAFDRSTIVASNILSWDDVVADMVERVGMGDLRTTRAMEEQHEGSETRAP